MPAAVVTAPLTLVLRNVFERDLLKRPRRHAGQQALALGGTLLFQRITTGSQQAPIFKGALPRLRQRDISAAAKPDVMCLAVDHVTEDP
jgi:hypothetical protein